MQLGVLVTCEDSCHIDQYVASMVVVRSLLPLGGGDLDAALYGTL